MSSSAFWEKAEDIAFVMVMAYLAGVAVLCAAALLSIVHDGWK